MANIANVKVKSGNLLELSGSSVSISGSGGVVLHTENGGIDANAGTGPITLDAGSVSVNAGSGKVDLTGSTVNLVGNATVSKDLDVTGNITGSNLLLTGEIIAKKMSIVETLYTSSVLYSSGSTKFGNTPGDGPGLEDTHQFSGSLYITGSTVTLTGGSFTGNGSGLTNVTASAVTLTQTNGADTAHYITFVDTATGDENLRTDTGLTYNPSTNSLTASFFSGSLKGNADTVTDGAYLSAGQTFTGANVFNDAANQFTGSFSGDGSNLTNLDAGDISQGTLAIARGGTNNTSFTDVHQGSGGEVFLVAQSGSVGNEKLQSIALTGSAGVIVGFDGTKITLNLGSSVGSGTVTEVIAGEGLDGGVASGGSSGTLSVSASAGGGINVASTGISVDDSIVLTTSGTGPYDMAAAVSSSIGFSGSVGLFGTLTAGSGDIAGALTVGTIAADNAAGSNTFAGDVSLDRSLKLNMTHVLTGQTHHANSDIIISAATNTTIVLPTPAGAADDGRYFTIKCADLNTNANGVVINGGTKLIDSKPTYTLFGPFQSVTVVYSDQVGQWLVL